MGTQAETNNGNYLDILARYIASAKYHDIPEDVRLHARYIVLDTIGAILSGSGEPENTALAVSLASTDERSTLFRLGFPKAALEHAVLVNGTAGTAMEQDEGHPPVGHPAIYTLPALISLSEEIGASGEQLLEAFILSYEAYVRFATSIQFAPGLHTHGSIATVAAAIAAARISGFDASNIRETINVAACLNTATPFYTANEGATVRNVYAGLAGRNGLLAAQLVRSGFTGPIDGPGEVYSWLLGRGVDPSLITHALGEKFEIRTNYFKLHAACRYTHAPLDALSNALESTAVLPMDIVSITVIGNENAAACNRQDPQNMLAAKFSVPFSLATAIVHGHTKPDAFRQEAVDNQTARDLAKRITVSESPEYTKLFPAQQIATVEVHLRTGGVLTGKVTNPRGAERDPVSYPEVSAKFELLGGAVFGDKVDEARALILTINEATTMGEFTERLRSLSLFY